MAITKNKPSPAVLIAGLFALTGFILFFGTVPLVEVVLLYWWLKWEPKSDKAKKATVVKPEIAVFNFDDYDVGELPAYVPEPIKPTVPDNIIEDAVSVLINLRTNKGLAKEAVTQAVENGAETIEEIVKQSLQTLNKR